MGIVQKLGGKVVQIQPTPENKTVLRPEHSTALTNLFILILSGSPTGIQTPIHRLEGECPVQLNDRATSSLTHPAYTTMTM